MHRLAIVLVVAACGSKRAKPVPAPPDALVVKAPPPAAPSDDKRVPTDYQLEAGDLVVDLMVVPPAGWKDQSDYPHLVVYATDRGSTIRIELLAGAAKAAGPQEIVKAVDGPNGPFSLRCQVALDPADAALEAAALKTCNDLAPDPIRDDLLDWKITLAPDTVKLADVASVAIGFQVTNKTTGVVNAHHNPLQIQIDGASTPEIDMAFGNGGFGAEWYELEPNQSASDSRSGIAWATTAGDHEVTLLRLDHVIAKAVLHVTK